MKFKVFSFNKVNSTNDLAIKKIRKGYNKGLIITSEQKKGRGQYGKKWISIKGNLFVSLFFEISKKKSTKKITFINCYIIKKVITKFVNNKKITIKLPNDIQINKKKVCGILQEIITKNEKKFIIIGIGINLIKNPLIKNYQNQIF